MPVEMKMGNCLDAISSINGMLVISAEAILNAGTSNE